MHFFAGSLSFRSIRLSPESEQDPELAKKIIASELSGVFNWLLDGLRRLLSQKKFTQSEIVRNQIEAYRRESDSVAMFMEEEGYTPSVGGGYILLKTLYSTYRSFCYENGYCPCSIGHMSNRLAKAGYFIKRIAPGRAVYAQKNSSM